VVPLAVLIVVPDRRNTTISLTIEFYSAEQQELVALFAKLFTIQFSDNPAGEDDLLVDQLETYPKAEFPGRLLIPDALDRLCIILKQYHPLIPSLFHEVCAKELWNDGLGSESLTLLSDQFVSELAAFSEHEIQQAAFKWAATFPLQEPFHQTLPYKAVIQLREVALVTKIAGNSLMFYLAGAPGFFEYLRHL
jgi:hypothetical protein